MRNWMPVGKSKSFNLGPNPTWGAESGRGKSASMQGRPIRPSAIEQALGLLAVHPG